MTPRWSLLALALLSCHAPATGPAPLADAGTTTTTTGDAPDAGAPAPPVKRNGLVFTDVSPAEPPYEITPATADQQPTDTSGLFADLDGDGSDELVISAVRGGRSYRFDPAQGRFVPLSPERRFDSFVNMLADLDYDGRIDAFSGRGGVQIKWGWGGTQPPVLFRDQHWTSTGSLTLTDLDRDGLADVVGAGSCCGDPACVDLGIALHTGPRAFEALGGANGLPVGGRIRSYLGAMLPVGPGQVLFELGDACDGQIGQAATFRVSGLDARRRPVFEAFDPFPPGALFREGDPRRTLIDIAPMAAASADFDGDGVLDLFVSTNPYHSLFRADAQGGLVERSASQPFFRVPGEQHFQIPWGVAPIDLDFDGLPDLVVVHGNDENARTRPEWFVGPQGVGFYRNKGDFRFEDLTNEAAFPAGQYRALTVGDFDCDGDADLIVGALEAWPKVWRNDSTGNHGLSLRLRASDGTPAPGTRVDVWTDAGVQHLVAGATASPTVSGESWAFAGLGSGTSASRIRIAWPSGLVQELGAQEGGKCLKLQEPATWTIDPPARVAPAGSAFTVTAHGSSALRTVLGTAEITADPQQPGTWSVLSNVPGEVVLEALIDGSPFGIRPRLTWSAP